MSINTEALLAEEERLAEEVYDRLVRPVLRPEDAGKYVAIAFESGDFEVDSDDYAATGRLLARRPGADLANAGRRGCCISHAGPFPGWVMTIRARSTAQLEAVVRLRLRGPGGAEAEVNAVVDTGYTGSLTLPDAVAIALGLMRRSGGQAVLADGSSRRFNTYAAEVEWSDSWRGVVASALGDEALVGMGLLAGHDLRVEVVAGGRVTVEPLSPPAEA